jgi:hypothetical protein
VHNSDDSKVLGRRRTLQLLGMGLTAGGLLGLGCKQNSGTPSGGTESQGSTAADCYATIDDTSKGLRRTLQYKDKSDTPDKKCSSCAQYDAGKFGDCGGCKLFTGPVNPNGACLSFAPKGAAPAKSG